MSEEFDADQEEDVELFRAALGKAQRAVRDGVDFAQTIDPRALKSIAGAFEAIEAKYWLAERVTDIVGDPDLNVIESMRVMIWSCEEFAPIRALRGHIRLVWRLSAALKSGRVKVGEARKVPQRQQDIDPSAAYEITLCLPAWLGLDEHQRARVLHHELCHILGWATTGDGEHEVMEFASTLARFGAGDAYQARAIASFTSRPAQEAELRRFGYDPISGQGLLFPTDYEPAQPIGGGVTVTVRTGTMTTAKTL